MQSILSMREVGLCLALEMAGMEEEPQLGRQFQAKLSALFRAGRRAGTQVPM